MIYINKKIASALLIITVPILGCSTNKGINEQCKNEIYLKAEDKTTHIFAYECIKSHRYVLLLNTKDGPKELLESNNPIYLPVLSSNQSHVAYFSDENGTPSAFVQEIKTGKRRLLEDNVKNAIKIEFSADSKSVFINNIKPGYGIWDVAGSSVTLFDFIKQQQSVPTDAVVQYCRDKSPSTIKLVEEAYPIYKKKFDEVFSAWIDKQPELKNDKVDPDEIKKGEALMKEGKDMILNGINKYEPDQYCAWMAKRLKETTIESLTQALQKYEEGVKRINDK